MDTKSVKKHIVNVLRTSRALDSRIEFHLNWIKHLRQQNNCKKMYHNCSSFIFSLMGDIKTSVEEKLGHLMCCPDGRRLETSSKDTPFCTACTRHSLVGKRRSFWEYVSEHVAIPVQDPQFSLILLSQYKMSSLNMKIFEHSRNLVFVDIVKICF